MQARRALLALLTAAAVSAFCAGLLLGYFYLEARLRPFPRTQVRIEGDKTYRLDTELGFAPVANGRSLRLDPTHDLTFNVLTDQRGLRVDAAHHQTPSKIDVLAIGGSHTWGHGLESRDTFARILGRSLGLEVANAGYPSYGTVQSLQMARRHLDLEPSLVIYSFIDDHLRRNLSPCAPSYSPFCSPVSYLDFDPEGRPFIRPPRLDHYSAELGEKYYSEILMTEGVGWNDVLWKMRVGLFRLSWRAPGRVAPDPEKAVAGMRYLVGELAASVAAADASLVVMYIPDLRTGASALPERLRGELENQYLFVDLTRPVRDHLEMSREPLALSDGHPSAAGHLLFAQRLERLVREQSLIRGAG